MSLLLICQILGLFINILTADDKYFLCYTENLWKPIKLKLFQKNFFFLNLLLHFQNLKQILNIL